MRPVRIELIELEKIEDDLPVVLLLLHHKIDAFLQQLDVRRIESGIESYFLKDGVNFQPFDSFHSFPQLGELLVERHVEGL